MYLSSIVQWLEAHQLPCAIKSTFGVACPGCGFQGSLILLLKGDLVGSFFAYPPLMPMFLLFGFLGAHLIFRFHKGGTILKYMFFATTLTILINFICKQALNT